jgi:hypothetical protein
MRVNFYSSERVLSRSTPGPTTTKLWKTAKGCGEHLSALAFGIPGTALSSALGRSSARKPVWWCGAAFIRPFSTYCSRLRKTSTRHQVYSTKQASFQHPKQLTFR